MAKNAKLSINWQVLALKCGFKPKEMAIIANCSTRTVERKVRGSLGKTIRALKMEWKSSRIKDLAAARHTAKEIIEKVRFSQTSSRSRHLKNHHEQGLCALKKRQTG